LIYVLFFVGVTAVWGWTFVVVKNAIAEYPTLPFLQLRFLLAFVVMVVLVRRLPTRKELLVGLVTGSVLAAGYLTQTLGLNLISPGNAGLITGLLVLFTPFIDRLFGVPFEATNRGRRDRGGGRHRFGNRRSVGVWPRRPPGRYLRCVPSASHSPPEPLVAGS
jgi:hypothetical protein